MKENNMLKIILSNLDDIIVVEDEVGNICYKNHPEIDYNLFTGETKSNDEYFDDKSSQWYKLKKTTFDFEDKHYILKKYTDITQVKKHQLESEKDGKTDLLRSEVFKKKVEFLSEIGKKIVFVVFDIDDFKKINDRYGHIKGDEVLGKIGLAIRTTFRSSDLFGRFGGDEFALGLIDIDLNIAMQKLEMLKQYINSIVLDNDTQDRVTISVGCDLYDNKLSFDDNFQKVDKIQYFSKNNGKNQINSLETINLLNERYGTDGKSMSHHKSL